LSMIVGTLASLSGISVPIVRSTGPILQNIA
jgi:hypothetical protein